jgi:hypothetical protein
MQAIESFLNNPLSVSILVILVSSLVGFYINSRVRDRCLRDFDSFRITVENKAGKTIWGKLRVYSSGIELLYKSGYKDEQGHVENSYILYGSELANVQAVYRFHDDQSARDQQRRTRDIERTYQPNIFRQLARALRNLFSTFKDAIVQATNTVLGYRAAQSPENVMLSKHKELTDSGAQLLSGTVGNAYEPILERYIGQYVVVEIASGDTVEEEYGILKEYSSKYVELLNVRIEVPLHVYLKETNEAKTTIQVAQEDGILHVTNPLRRELLVEAIRCDESSRPIDVQVPAYRHAAIELTEEERDKPVELQFGVRCLTDLIIPRAIGVVRHAGKRQKLSLEALLGLDDLPNIPWVKRLFDGQKIEIGSLASLIGDRSSGD